MQAERARRQGREGEEHGHSTDRPQPGLPAVASLCIAGRAAPQCRPPFRSPMAIGLASTGSEARNEVRHPQGAIQVPKITFVTAEGESIDVDGRPGETVMLAALVGMVPGIEAVCGGACSCGTCHVYVDPQWRDAVGEPRDLEAGMLEGVDNVTDASRLCCQIQIVDQLDGLVVRVPV